MAPLLRIGDWTVDGSANELWQEGGARRPLRHKAMATLLLLAETPGQVVARETLIERVWEGNAFVAQKAINTAIWTIRQALGDDPEAPRYVETIAKKGYRLIAPVQVLARTAAPAPAPSHGPRPWAVGALVLLGLAGLLGALSWQARQTAAPPAALHSRWLTQLPGVEFLGQHSPDGRWLAFAWWQGQGDAALVLRSATGREPPRKLAHTQGDVHSLAWLDGGKALAFTALQDGRCQLWRVELSPGAQPRALAECQPLFTPILAASEDGRTLVFSAPGAGRPGLFALQSDGSGLRRLTTAPDPQLPDHQPAFAPDGQRLAFARSQPGQGTRDLYELDLSGGAPRRLTSQDFSSLHGLAYAADGQDLILSTTQLEVRMLQRWQRRSGQLQALGQEGSAPMRERDGRLTVAVLRGSVGLAQWTPATGLQPLAPALVSRRQPALHAGSDALAFVARAQPGFSQLWVAAPALAEPQERLQLPGEIGRPAWSPDGQTLAFWGRCGSATQLALCAWPRQGGAVQVLLQDGQPGGPPVWLDAHTLAFSRPQGPQWRVWTLRLGGTPQPLPGAPALRSQARLAVFADGGERGIWAQGADGLLHWQPGAGSAQPWTAQGIEAEERVIGWTLHPEGGLWLLTRGRQERLLHQRHADAPAQEQARWPLGTLAEFPSLSAAPGRLVLERSGGAQGDLMELRQAIDP